LNRVWVYRIKRRAQRVSRPGRLSRVRRTMPFRESAGLTYLILDATRSVH
jgi:hypothetical protein